MKGLSGAADTRYIGTIGAISNRRGQAARRDVNGFGGTGVMPGILMWRANEIRGDAN
jgi:hypothetical protein